MTPEHFNHTKIIADLEKFIHLLRKYEFESTNTIELRALNKVTSAEDIMLAYKTEDVVFHISKSGMKADRDIKNISVTLELEYTLEQELSNVIDIFSSYNLQLYIDGYIDGVKDKFFCWHLDREPKTRGRYIHPYYHFHAGGRKLREKDLGDLMLIGSPRIPHPPMDIILSIHFVILNFLDIEEYPEQLKILDDEEYKEILDRATQRILNPYFSTFNFGGHSVYSPQNLCPLYI